MDDEMNLPGSDEDGYDNGAKPAPDAATLALKPLLQRRLADQRAYLADLRIKLNHDIPDSKEFPKLNEVERDLDLAQQKLEAETPNLPQVSDELLATRNALDKVCKDLALHAWSLANRLTFCGVATAIIGCLIGFVVWKTSTLKDPNLMGLEASRWLVLRPALMAICGSFLGSTAYLVNVLYQSIHGRAFDVRKIRWYYLSPATGAVLSLGMYALVRAGLSGSGGSGGMTAAAGAFAIGFLIGFSPSSVLYRIISVVKSVFGTDEVGDPQIGTPQAKITDGQVEVKVVVTPSAATRVSAVTAYLLKGGNKGPSAALTASTDNAWNGAVAIDQSVLDDLAAYSLVIEAQDEAGNKATSTPVPLEGTAQTGLGSGATTAPGGANGALTITTKPAADGTLAKDQPLIVNFSSKVMDADPAVTTVTDDPEQAQTVPVIPSWTVEGTELNVVPENESKAWAPGHYRLVLEQITLLNGEESDQHVDLTFSVEESANGNGSGSANGTAG